MLSKEAFMSMLMVLSSTHCAHQSLVSMLTGLQCARAHEACVRTTTLGQSASRKQQSMFLFLFDMQPVPYCTD